MVSGWLRSSLLRPKADEENVEPAALRRGRHVLRLLRGELRAEDPAAEAVLFFFLLFFFSFFFFFLPAHVLWRGNLENDEKEKKSPAY